MGKTGRTRARSRGAQQEPQRQPNFAEPSSTDAPDTQGSASPEALTAAPRTGIRSSPRRLSLPAASPVAHRLGYSGAAPRILQPASAAAARAQAADRLAAQLAAETGPYSLCGGDANQLLRICRESADTQTRGIPKGTRRSDEWG
eukprot:398887-Pleurochrysis_carterae.AAC.1